MKNLLQTIQTLEPVAFGGFSELYIINDKAVKLMEDTCYRDVLQETYRQRLAADAGLAPQVYAVEREGEKVVVEMDLIDNTRWFHPDAEEGIAPTLLGELPIDQMAIGLQLYINLLKANIVHADFHSGNWFMDEDGNSLAIDFGLGSELSTCSLKHAKRACQFLAPALEALGYQAEAEELAFAFDGEVEEIREALAEVASAF